MPWSDAFWKPIKLKDGRTVATLAEARVLILSLPGSQQEPHWVEASELLARASEFPSARDIALAAMLRALRACSDATRRRRDPVRSDQPDPDAGLQAVRAQGRLQRRPAAQAKHGDAKLPDLRRNRVSSCRAGVASVHQLHDLTKEKREALGAWGERLSAIVEGRETANNVIPLRA
jgi:hypothetical protein